jgi:hypothetical protein
MSKKLVLKKKTIVPEQPTILEPVQVVQYTTQVNESTVKTKPRGRGRPRLGRDPEEAQMSYAIKQHEKNRAASGKSDRDAIIKLEESVRLLKVFKAENPTKFIRLKIIGSINNLFNSVKLINGEPDTS